MINNLSEKQLEAIDYYLRKTCEPYDDWDWDGNEVSVWLDDFPIERYNFDHLKEMIENFENL